MASAWSLTTSPRVRSISVLTGRNSSDEGLTSSPKSSSWYSDESGWRDTLSCYWAVIFSWRKLLVLMTLAIFSCCTLFVLHFGQVALFPRGTFFMLHYFILQVSRDALFSCFTNSMLLFFSWYTLFMLHIFRVLFFFVLLHVALFCCCTLFALHFFYVAFFLSYSLFMLHLFACCTFFMLQLFSCCFILNSFHVALFSCYTLFVFHFFRVAVFSCCTLFMLLFLRVAHFSSCTNSVRVTLIMLHLFPYCILFILNVFSWCTVAIFFVFFSCCFMLYLFRAALLNVTVLSSRTIFMFYFFHIVVHFFALFSCFTFFRVGLFSCCNFFMLHFFPVWTFTYDLFLVLVFFRPSFLLLFLTLRTFHIVIFHVTLSSWCTFSLKHISHMLLYSYYTFPERGNGCYTKTALNQSSWSFAYLERLPL